jgi:hypothetical protein
MGEAAWMVRRELGKAIVKLHLGAKVRVGVLTDREWLLLALRLRGQSMGEVARALRVCKGRVQALEARALAKLGRAAGNRRHGATVGRVFRTQRAEWALGRDEGRPVLRVGPEELHADPEDAPRVRRTCRRPEAERRLAALATRLLREAGRGVLSEERRAWYAAEAERVAVA